MKFNLDKNLDFCKKMVPSWYDILAFVLALLIGAFAKDFNLESVMSVCGAVMLYELCYWFVWLSYAIFCVCVKVKRDKKQKKECIDNEDK